MFGVLDRDEARDGSRRDEDEPAPPATPEIARSDDESTIATAEIPAKGVE